MEVHLRLVIEERVLDYRKGNLPKGDHNTVGGGLTAGHSCLFV